MKIHRVQIENFRNFKRVDVFLGDQVVIVGENKIGKTNFLYALRLVLDPTLPDSARQLQESDFWDGIPRPLTKNNFISISIDLKDFEDNEDLMAILAEHLICSNPLIARLSYRFQPLPTIEGDPKSDSDYEFMIFGGDRIENKIGYEVRRRIPFDILHALRDAESDLSTWKRSPLKPLLDKAIAKIDRQEIIDIADEITDVTSSLKDIDEINKLSLGINKQLENMVGSTHAIETALGFSPSDPDRLFRAIRLFIDGGRRGIGDASLGSANLLYLVLKTLELNQLVEQNNRDHTFLAIEEPEAHLHPHIQRLVYRYLLQPDSSTVSMENDSNVNKHVTTILTTHSPHIVSIAPLRSIVLLKKSENEEGTEVVSTANVKLAPEDIDDLERYLDVTRGEMLFAKGVILVEGDAEKFIIPVVAKKLGYDLDELGITVCSVSGTNFTPYVKLLNANCLNLPFAVLTDLDPQDSGEPLGHNRVIKLLHELMNVQEYQDLEPDQMLLEAPKHGIFMNNYTLEIDLFKSGRHKSMCKTIMELSDNGMAISRAKEWKEKPESLDEERFLKDINEIGKGRFAQRLATNILSNTGKVCPSYIKEAFKYVTKKVSN